MTTSFRARALACALLAGTAAAALTATPAAAQIAPPAPVRQSIDGNGVDLFAGTVNVDAPALTMGQGGNSLSYFALNRGSGWTDNMAITLSLNGSVMTASFGGTSDSFTVSGTTYTATEGNGATLTFNSGTQIYTYTARDGTIVHFSKGMANAAPYYSNQGPATDVTHRSGAKLLFAYDQIEYCSSSRQGGLGQICLTHAYVNRLNSVRNSFGYRLEFTYESDAPVDPDSVPQTADFQALSHVTGVTGSNLAASGSGPSQSLWSDPVTGGISFEVTDAMSRTTKYRTLSGAVAGITRPGNSSEDVTYTYSSGRVTSVATPASTTSYSASDSSGVRTVTVTDALSHATAYAFDIASRRMTSVTDALSHTTSYQYDSSGRLTRVTAPEGNYVAYTYDGRGNVTETRAVAKSSSGLSDIVATASFDSSCSNTAKCNKPNSVTDARGNTTDYTYDSSHGGVLTVTAPAPTSGATRPQTRYSYTSYQAYFSNGSSIVASGEPVYLPTATSACVSGSSCTGTSSEVVSSVSYGPQSSGTGNNLLPVSTSSGAGDSSLTATTAMTYDYFGNLETVDGPLSGTADTVRFRYNADRERIGTVSPDPDGAGSLKHRAQRVTIDGHGLVTKVESGNVNSQSDSDWSAFSAAQAVETGYDSAWRPVTRALKSGSTAYALTQTSYDAAGRPICTAQRMNPSAYGSLPSDACTLGTSGSYGYDRIAVTTYDNADRVTLVTSAYGVTADQANEVAATYTNNGKVQTVTDAESNKTTYVYDGHDRLYQTQYPSSTKGAGTSNSSDYEQLTYDANSNATSRRLRDGNSIGYTFDALNRLTAKDLPGSEPDVTYVYDLLSRMTSAATSSHTLSFTFDALDRNLTQVGPQGTVTSTWDIGGRRTRITHADSFYVDYDYLVTGDVSAIRENGATSGVGVLATYAYDNLGRRTGITFGNGTSNSYSYDAVSRLTSLGHDMSGSTYDQTLAFSYSPASQITQNTRSNDLFAWAGHGTGSTSITSNGLNQLTVIGGTSTSHDSRGNMTGDGLGHAFGYSSENLLTSGPSSTTLSYDPAMRLYHVAGAATTRFQYDGADLIAEYNSSNSLQRRYVHGPGTDAPVVWYEGSGTTDRRFLQADERGSVVAVSNSSGTITNVNTYDEYGKPGSGNVGRFQYTGQKWISELGLYDYKARMYHPSLGRFMQTDPIGYGDGMNWYNYVGGDPVNGTDPTGMRLLKHERCSGCICWDEGDLPGGTGGSPSPTSSAGDPGSSGSAAGAAAAGQAGWDSQDEIVVTARVRPSDIHLAGVNWMGDHEYITKNVICPSAWQCSAAEVASVYSLQEFQIPGVESSGPIQNGKIYTVHSGILSGQVQTYISKGGLTVNNITMLHHPACCGFVTRNAILEPNGDWYSITHGKGTNIFGGFVNALGNVYLGRRIFNQLDAKIYEALEEMKDQD